MTQPKDEWRSGAHTYIRDVGNEQKINLVGNAGTVANPTPGSKFEGVRRNIAQFPGFLLSYGSNQPFTMKIEFFKEQNGGSPTGSVSPQVRGPIGGFYSVISAQPRSSFLGPFYRMVIQNGTSAQAFFQNYAILSDEFQGHIISVNGPIPLLGLGPVGMSLLWGYGPINPLTGLRAPTELTVDALGKLSIANLPAEFPLPAAQVATLTPPAAPANYPLPAAQVTALTPPAFPASYPLPSAQVTTLTPPAFPAGFNVLNFPSVQSVSQTGTPFKHLSAAATTVIKNGPGVLRTVVVNKYAVAANVTLTLYNALTADPANIIAVIQVGGIFAGSQTGQPLTLTYDLSFATALTAVLSAVGADTTVIYS